MENLGKVPMVVLIEVQTGVYLDGDDIIRYEDIYAQEQKITFQVKLVNDYHFRSTSKESYSQ